MFERLLNIIWPKYRWAVIHIMGRGSLFGIVKPWRGGWLVRTFEPDQGHIMVESFVGPSAVFRIEWTSETDVRHSYVAQFRNYDACGSFVSHVVCSDRCANCGAMFGEHEVKVASSVEPFDDIPF